MTMRIAAMTVLGLLLAAPPLAEAPFNQSWCATDIEGAVNCGYASLADCEKGTRLDARCKANPYGEID